MKRAKTLSYKLSLIFIGGMTFAMIGVAITTYLVQNRIVNNFTTSRLQNSVYEFSKETDDDLLRVETIVKSTKALVENKFQTTAQVADEGYVADALQEITNSSALHMLAHEEYADICAHYVFINPEYTNLKAEDEAGNGFFHVKDVNGEFYDAPVTNILKYDRDDVSHVGWWYSIADSKEATWMNPYYNENINRNMFSYVQPYFSKNNELLGLIGIDIDLNLMIKDINKFGDFSNAYAYLATSEGKIISHKDVETIVDGKYVGSEKTLKDLTEYENFAESEDGAITYRYKGERRTAMSITLSNGFKYGVSVKTGELRQPIRLVIIIPILVYMGLLVLIAFLYYMLIKRYVKPLQDLHGAVDKVRKGDYKFQIEAKRDDEIGDLTKAFSVMVSALAEKNRMISAMAFTDGLTGVKNSNAYRDIEKRIEKQIKDGTAKFAIVMLDVDKLKMINDNLGHESGDRAIIGSCYSLCKGFSHSPVFRVGGDEFVAIAEGEDYERRYEIYEKLRNNLILVKNIKYDFSVGMATFEPGVDHSFKDVFARADQEMYLNKKAKRRYEQD